MSSSRSHRDRGNDRGSGSYYRRDHIKSEPPSPPVLNSGGRPAERHYKKERHRSRSPVGFAHHAASRDQDPMSRPPSRHDDHSQRERVVSSRRAHSPQVGSARYQDQPQSSSREHSSRQAEPTKRTSGTTSRRSPSPHRTRKQTDERGDSDRNREYNGRKRDPAREKDWNNFFKNVEIKPERPESEKYGVQTDKDDSAPPVEKEKPNFGLSGKLTEETNTFKGVVIKYSEPPEARKPQKIRWRLYPFKANEELPVMFIHRQSAYLLGRDRKIADIPIDHPSCSKQHAVIQYRLQPYTRTDGTKGRRVKPYIIDLESANGTLVNEVKIEPKRYVELFEKDVLKFGFSSREYVLLHEHSKDEPDDDEPEAPASPLPDVKVKKEKDELD